MSEPKPMPSYWSLYQEVTHLNGWTDKLRAENAKLRELVADMWLQLLNAYDRKEVDEFVDRMRELGVEVE